MRRRLRVTVKGIVQGVGFRPFVYSLALRHRLSGFVLNDTSGVLIEVEGEEGALRAFLSDLETRRPPLAEIEAIESVEVRPLGEQRFRILESKGGGERETLVSPDIATCEECLREVLDPSDRRYRYPFTNCTNCGPRFTIILDLPYDRPKTTMRKFEMCKLCREEYEDPLDRRFHAQPTCCPACGPKVWLADGEGRRINCQDPISEAARLLREGRIVAIKGLGGFHIACDATDEGVVSELRRRKGREAKPFAVMVASVEAAREICQVDESAEEILSSPRRPIVLLPKRDHDPLAPSVAPGLSEHGLMLPYTPLHHLLLMEVGRPLVMTSGNLTDEPICKDNEEALERLKGTADFFLLHDRDIHQRCDDSVVKAFRGSPYPVRRSRGYVPHPVRLPLESPAHILAVGGHLKNTFCVVKRDLAFLSQHIGDLDDYRTLQFFREAVEHFERLFSIEPEVVAHDMHPNYLSTKFARSLEGLDKVPVQHHHAHVASCMAENGVTEPVLGVAFDGTGYGLDGTAWGGEFLVATYRGFERAGHLLPAPLPGGEGAIKEPWRMAASYALLSGEEGALDLPSLSQVPRGRLEAIVKLTKALIRQGPKGRPAQFSSGVGRLFDAVSALCGLRLFAEYEGQAAMELEARIRGDLDISGEGYPFDIEEGGGRLLLLPQAAIRGVVADLKKGRAAPEVSAKFHIGLARATVEACTRIAKSRGLRKVCLSGGVFQNLHLLELVCRGLERAGLEPVIHRKVPANDGGLSLGQAAVACARGRG